MLLQRVPVQGEKRPGLTRVRVNSFPSSDQPPPPRSSLAVASPIALLPPHPTPPTHPPVPSAHGSHGSRRPPGRLGAGARGVPTPVPGGRHPAAAAGRASSRDEPLRGLRPVAQPALQE
jgi:hypothetical protein